MSLQFFIIILIVFIAEVAAAVLILLYQPTVSAKILNIHLLAIGTPTHKPAVLFYAVP